MKEKAGGMNLGVKRLTDAFAPGMEVIFNMQHNFRIIVYPVALRVDMDTRSGLHHESCSCNIAISCFVAPEPPSGLAQAWLRVE